MRRLLLASVVVLVAGVGAPLSMSASGTASAGRWVIRDLGTLGGSHSNAVAINDRSQVVGTSRAANGERRVFLWQDGTMRDIGRYGWDVPWPILLNERGQVAWTEKGRGGVFWEHGVTRPIPFSPWALNDRGQVVGGRTSSSGKPHAVIWENGALRDLGVLPRHEWSRARALNNTGVVVGDSFLKDSPESRAFIWQHGTMRDLGVLPGFMACEAVAVNDRGQVLGYCTTSTSSRLHAFLWENGKMRDLGWPRADYVNPVALNDSGQVILWTRVAGETHMFLWEHGKVRDLGWLGRDTTMSPVSDLNERGQIVGSSLVSARLRRAFLWQDGTMTDIARGRWSVAADINNQGQIAGERGTGKSAHGTRIVHAVLWTRQPAN